MILDIFNDGVEPDIEPTADPDSPPLYCTLGCPSYPPFAVRNTHA